MRSPHRIPAAWILGSALLGWSAWAAAAEPAPAPRFDFKFQDARITSVMDYLSRETGWVFMLDNSEKGRDRVKDLASKVTLTAMQAQVTPEKALDLMNSALASFGLQAVRIRETVIVMTTEDAKKRSFEIYSGSNPDDVAYGDNFITQIIPLQYSDADQVRKDLQDLVSDKGKLYINKQSNALILVDSSTNVRRFLTLIRLLDQGVTKELEIRPFTLKNADATEVSRVVREIFEEESGQQQRGGGGRQEEQAQTVPGQKVKVSVDPRTNTVVVKCTKDSMVLIEKLIHEMDLKPVEVETTFVVHLKNADVTNVATILNNTLRASSSSSSSRRTTTGGQGGGMQFPFQALFGGGQGGTRGGQTGGGRTGGGGFQPMRAQEGEGGDGAGSGGTAGMEQLFGDVRVQADTESNSLVVLTNPKNYPLIKRLIDSLDMVRAQALIKVFIAEVTLDNETELGMEWSWQDNLQVGDDQGSASSWTNFDLASGTNLTGFRYQLLSENVDVLVRALKRKGKLKVLSAPRILVLDNQQATINVGREIPRITNSRVTDQGSVINSVQYENVGIALQVTPHINPDGLVRMAIQPEVSEVAPKSEGVPISEGAVAPVFVTSTAQTTVSIKDGYTVIIGGLIRDRISVSESKVPIIGDIPLLNLLFNSTSTEITKTELMIFLTPVVVRNQESLKQLSERETQSLEIMERWFLDRIANDGIPLDRIRRKRLAESLD
ncbi:MAG: type II secretion system secretin GspD [Planctomycetes bacterium]|nr:type II secretion system secretin GspD [Planctomycetota bacterium]